MFFLLCFAFSRSTFIGSHVGFVNPFLVCFPIVFSWFPSVLAASCFVSTFAVSAIPRSLPAHPPPHSSTYLTQHLSQLSFLLEILQLLLYSAGKFPCFQISNVFPVPTRLITSSFDILWPIGVCFAMISSLFRLFFQNDHMTRHRKRMSPAFPHSLAHHVMLLYQVDTLMSYFPSLTSQKSQAMCLALPRPQKKVVDSRSLLWHIHWPAWDSLARKRPKPTSRCTAEAAAFDYTSQKVAHNDYW